MRQKKIYPISKSKSKSRNRSLKSKKDRKTKRKPRGTARRKTEIIARKSKKIIKEEDKSNVSMCAPYIEPSNLSSTKKLNKSNINIIKSATDESCFSLEALRKIASKWNTTHPDKAIEYTDSTTGKSLWNSINNAMSAKCNNEVCWLKQDFIKETPLSRDLLENFKPIMPKKWEENPREWLNTLDIRDVMNQYEVKHPDFEFIGPVPMDFDSKVGFGQCVINELCNIKLASLLEKGKHRIGVIFNLDKHTQPGSHWVAMFAKFPPSLKQLTTNNSTITNNSNGGNNGSNNGSNSGSNEVSEICYWDSYGMKPNPEVVVLMNRLKEQATELGHSVNIKINKYRHQYKNSECGVYCIYFLTSFLEGRSFEDIVSNIITDDKMFEKRKVFFAKAN